MDFLRITPEDTVAVALGDMPGGSSLPGGGRTLEAVPSGHKAALKDMKVGEKVIKYGASIGVVTRDIRAGACVHTHNLASGLDKDESYTYIKEPPSVAPRGGAPGFMGYPRADGQAGIRNELWVLPLVGCVSHTGQRIVDAARRAFGDAFTDYLCFPHPYGCSQSGDDAVQTRMLLAALAHNPNAGAVLALGLGCEVNRLKEFLPAVGAHDRLVSFDAQDVQDEVAHAIGMLRPFAEKAAGMLPSPQPITKLRIGLKCGGSDGYSGLTANPLLGALCDRMTAWGASCGMTEVPEMFGAERLLMNRAADERVFSDIVEMINGYKKYFRKHDLPVYDNPSPGNKDGGITTLEEKSLGCTYKAGSAEVVDVLPYSVRFRKEGLSLVTGPGNDLVACTALAAAGCQLVLFTTGRGTPYSGPVPTLKIATNTPLADKKKNWIDFDAGVLLGGVTMEKACDDLLALILDTASGKPAKAEEAGYREIAILKGGVTQ